MIVKPAFLRCLVPALSALLLTLCPFSLSAEQNNQLASAKERINFSGKLRMLSQRAAAAGCNLSANVNAEHNRQLLSLTSAEFSKILDALKFGNADLNIQGEETNEAILTALDTTKAQWQVFEENNMKRTSGSASSADSELIDTHNLALLESAQALVNAVLTSYSNSDASNGFNKVIDIAGKQRMLTQKISKEACQIWSGQDSDKNVKTLQATMEHFENAMVSLQEGTDGLIKPPTDRIKQILVGVWQQWNAVKPVLQKALAKQSVDLQSRQTLATELDHMLRDMNTAVGLYTVAGQQQGNIVDDGATERLNFSGKLRMLSQRVAAATCNFTAGIESEQSRSMLTGAQAEFVKITHALEFGDADLRINGEEKRRKTLEALSQLRKEWDPINTAINNILKGENTEENAAQIYDKNMPLLEAANLLFSEISGEYSDPTLMMQSDAMLVNISGRQRMLTQKMLKESCLFWSGQEAMADELSGTIDMFDMSLQALRVGLEAAGVKAAPTEEISQGLDIVWNHWHTVKPTLDNASSMDVTDFALRGILLEELNAILSEMNDVVSMYTIYGKTGL